LTSGTRWKVLHNGYSFPGVPLPASQFYVGHFLTVICLFFILIQCVMCDFFTFTTLWHSILVISEAILKVFGFDVCFQY
ncbi:hypothetical protein NNO04_00765, partial [Citrobacter sp. Awk 4]|uniref:hypothetical protein n=1 Tax=Citrobacter sp. Awk 4 TaxID=2963955 RepID=UPI002302729C